MSQRENSERFFYTASAVVLGGRLTKPEPEEIDGPHSATLSPSGGSADFRFENFHFREIVSFASARAKVVGNYDAATRTYNTLSTVTITGLEMLGMIAADAVVARLATAITPDGMRISTEGSHFVNLRIAGQPVANELVSTPTDGLRSAMIEDIPYQRQLIFPSSKLNGSYIDQFGTIFLGELLPDRGVPQLTMIRVELGCTVEGDTCMGAVQGGGRPWP